MSYTSGGYVCSPFFLLKARFIVETVCLCGPSRISANIPPGKAAGRRELKMVSTTSIQQKTESRKNKQSKVFFEKRKGENNPTLLE